EGAPSSIPGDLHDSISLLWRLELLGRDVGERWEPFAPIAGERLERQAPLFHAGPPAGGPTPPPRRAAPRAPPGKRRAPGARAPTGLVGDVLVPLVEGIHAFAARDYRRAVERIEPLTPRIVELGGSRAQRDVFHDTLLEATFRAGDMQRAERLLTDRVARR